MTQDLESTYECDFHEQIAVSKHNHCFRMDLFEVLHLD